MIGDSMLESAKSRSKMVTNSNESEVKSLDAPVPRLSTSMGETKHKGADARPTLPPPRKSAVK